MLVIIIIILLLLFNYFQPWFSQMAASVGATDTYKPAAGETACPQKIVGSAFCVCMEKSIALLRLMHCYVFTTPSLLSNIKFKTASLTGLANVLEDRHIVVESCMLDRPTDSKAPYCNYIPVHVKTIYYASCRACP